MKGEPIAFQWQENVTATYGPGISRPVKPERAKPYTLLVRQGQARPMRVTLLAESQKLALRYAANRWPEAAVEAA